METQIPASTQNKSESTAVLLSFLIPGIGQIYAGNTERGAIMIILSIMFGFISMATGGVFLLIQIPYWIWGMVDAADQARKSNDKSSGLQVQEQKKQEEVAVVMATTISAPEFSTQIGKLWDLYEAGIFDDAEFASKKSVVINSLTLKKPREGAEDFLSGIIPMIGKSLSKEDVIKIKELVYAE